METEIICGHYEDKIKISHFQSLDIDQIIALKGALINIIFHWIYFYYLKRNLVFLIMYNTFFFISFWCKVFFVFFFLFCEMRLKLKTIFSSFIDDTKQRNTLTIFIFLLFLLYFKSIKTKYLYISSKRVKLFNITSFGRSSCIYLVFRFYLYSLSRVISHKTQQNTPINKMNEK